MEIQRQIKLSNNCLSSWRSLVMLFILMCGTVAIHQAHAQSNLLTNPGFETAGASGWTETLTSSIYAFDATSAGEMHSGVQGRGYWMNSGTDGIGTVKQTVNSVAAGTYNASIWTRRENFATAFEYARFKLMNGSIQLGSVDLPYGSGYVNNTINNITIPGGASITVLVEYKVAGGNAYVTVDDAIFIMTSSGTVATPTFSPVAGTYTSTQSVAISTSTSGATIYYTQDGSTPTTSSAVYSSAISVASTKTIKALAVKSGMANSAVSSALYTINLPTVATPTFSPAAGTYTSAQTVSISTSTSGATIYYTTDGSTPTTSSSVYSSALSVGASQTIKALATKSGSANSSVASAAYTINISGGTGTGNVLREYWAGISGTSVSNLTSNANYPNNPTSTSLLTSFESPSGVADDYGQRVKGYVTAPSTGSYTFWIAADDDAELWLSTDGSTANKVKIASVTGWTSSQEWTKYSSQTSAAISLVGGTQYYIEALQKEGAGGDNLAVAWQVPGGSRVVIPGSALSTTLNGGGTTTVATPTFSPVAGTYTSAQSVSISTTTSSATIYYTTDGSTPTTSSSVYSSALSVSASQTIKALATKSGSTNSAVASASYTINIATPTVATPTFSPAAGTYTSTQSVSISTVTSGATIYYTTDGSTPTTSSTVYSAAISVASTQTVKAFAVKSGSTNSAIASATYTINAASTVATPTFSPGAGTYSTTQSVTISTTTSGATIYYTTDGTTPTTSSTVYSGAISVSSSKTIKALATASGSTNSAVASAAYTIGTVTAQAGITRQYWAGIAGSSVSALTSNANYPNNPTSTSVLTQFEAPQNVAETYGQKVSGYLNPTTTGSYTFWIASDDDSELWLSTSSNPANKVKIASVTGWTNYQEYNKYSSQQSASISLTANTYYYIEALQKDDTGGDHLTVVWQGPGITQQIISSTYLVTAPPTPPGSFSQTAPAGGATGVALSPTFSWGASSNANTYTLVVANNSSYTSPVINQTGISGTSYAGGGLAGTTTYYWKVTAVNAAGSVVASNAGLSFTTLTPPAPGTFTQTAPASGATGVSTYPAFSWAAASNASIYALVVANNSSYSTPIINQSGLTSTSYTAPSPFATGTVYYWKVTATNSTGSTVASNAGISFTTGTTSGTTYYVSTSGSDVPGNGSQGSPWRTLAYAASQVTAGTGNKTISIGAGTFVETQCTILPIGVNIVGAGEANTIITANGALPTPGVDQSSTDYPLWADGSMIQLKSPIYSGANPRYGDPSLMISPENGSQTISGFTMDGHSKTVKAGVWVENRSNVTMHHVTFKYFSLSGSVFSRGDMYWYVPLPAGKWMLNTSIHDCTFLNSGSTPGEQVGNLCLGGLDGADIYNITVTDDIGEGIKFQHVGHFRNTKIHDCTVTVGENDALWNEKISIELWNMSYDNELYNFNCNTWLSLVNHAQFTDYQPTAAHPSNLKVRNVRIIDQDGTSSVEAIECALSGVEISDSYIQDKGFGVAIWGGSAWAGNIDNHDVNIHNNIFANVNRPISYGFGNSAAVFVPDRANNIKIHNNVFDKMGNGLQLDNASTVSIKNNVFQNCGGADVQAGSSLTFTNNLRYNTDPQKPNWVVSTSVDATNIQGNPGFKNSGSRWTTYYQPASGSSLVVDKGTNVGLPFSGSNPDIGRWEFGLTSFRASTSETVTEVSGEDDSMISSYPNPTTGVVKIASSPDVKISSVQVLNTQGKIVLTKSANKYNSVDIDLSGQHADVYIFRINHQRGVTVKKVVLIR